MKIHSGFRNQLCLNASDPRLDHAIFSEGNASSYNLVISLYSLRVIKRLEFQCHHLP